MTIKIRCKDAKIEGSYNRDFVIEIDDINEIDADINDILKHFEYDDVLKYKDIFAVIDSLDTDLILKRIDKNTIMQYIIEDDELSQEILNMIDEKFIIGKARKLKIENLLQNAK